MKLPMRFRIMHLISQNDSVNNQEIMKFLGDEYTGEGQYKLSVIDTHLMSMRAVGIIEIANAFLNESGNLVQEFKITDYGKQLLSSYLPKEWQQ